VTVELPDWSSGSWLPDYYTMPSESPSYSVPASSSPALSILSPENITYTAIHEPSITVPLTFETSASLSWVGYSLDGGSNVTISENGTLIKIPAESRCLTLYANGTAGNWATPETVYYSITFDSGPESSSPVPMPVVVSAAVGTPLAVAGLVYLRKRKELHS
jgi:hypothetical protein